MRDIATQAYNYVHQYGVAPKDHLFDLLEEAVQDEKRGELVLEILRNVHSLQHSGFNEEYVVNQLSHFVRLQRLKTAVVSMLDAAESGNVEEADEAIDKYRQATYAQFSPGLTLKEYVKTLGNDTHDELVADLGIPAFDRHRLGPARKTMHTFLAPPKRGKTWWGLHVAKRGLLQRRKVVIVTLEVSARVMAARLLQSFFSMTRNEAKDLYLPEVTRDNKGRVEGLDLVEAAGRLALSSAAGQAKVKRAFGQLSNSSEYLSVAARTSQNLVIQEFPTGTLHMKDLEAYLENLVASLRFMPDMIVLDYADLMHLDTRNYRLSIGMLGKQLRGMAVERNLALVTMSQSNRGSLARRVITEGDVAEDFSKIAISDVVISYNQMPNEREMQTARLFVPVARDARDKFGVVITQAYALGQFCLDSFEIDRKSYEAMLPKSTGREEEDDDNERGDE
jgi:replicative DNA helicase